MQKITEVTIYKCDDGKEFKDKNEAIEYVNICERAEQAEDILGYNRIKWNVCPWIIKHTKEKVETYRKAICEIAADYYPQYSDLFIKCGNGEVKFNDAWKIVVDKHTRHHYMLYNAFERFECIDGKTFIEYPSKCICDHDIDDNVTIHTDIYGDNYGTINIL